MKLYFMTKFVIFIFLSVLQTNSSKRIIDIYAKDKFDKLFIEQTKVFAANTGGMKERDIIVKEHFGASAFKITLTGKDAEVKYTSKSIFPIQKLYSIVDAMPMRKNEAAKRDQYKK
ncbi:DUF4174 domain-containing protein [Pedobacter mucosus]|uniref:DUF4174 domain-containing protein n=1 Tax=Pedobacter mucosus TaxID=2895286 RepID=UPI001EE3CC44|nr:DUF4174 domain-containing protein [Pedobacter mucosus]UKT64964.1 DUF4174 domain-containing protein [Pedobacter mucosus]